MRSRATLAIFCVIGLVFLAGCTSFIEDESDEEFPLETESVPSDTLEPDVNDSSSEESSDEDSDAQDEETEVSDSDELSDVLPPSILTSNVEDGEVFENETERVTIEIEYFDTASSINEDSFTVYVYESGTLSDDVLSNQRTELGREIQVGTSAGNEYRIVAYISNEGGARAVTSTNFVVESDESDELEPVDLPPTDDEISSFNPTPTDSPLVDPNNNPPTAIIQVENTVFELGETIEFDGTDSFDPDGDPLTYEWDFDDGSPVTTEESPSHSYDSVGLYEVSLTVDDSWTDGTDTTTQLIEIVADVEPVVADAGDELFIFTGVDVTLDGTDTENPSGRDISYSWDLGNGVVLEDAGPTPTVSYAEEGVYTVELTVEDFTGAVDTDTVRVEARDENLDPVANAGEDISALNTTVVEFDGSESEDPEGDELSYTWDFGDGQTGVGVETDHTYDERGEYTVQLTVEDPWGATDTDTLTVTIENNPPDADFTIAGTFGENADGDPIVPTNGTVEFTSTSIDIDGDSLTHTWDFGDGSGSTGDVVEHTYTEDGLYAATITSQDSFGGVGTAGIVVESAQVDPVADGGEDVITVLGRTETFSASNSFDPNNGDLTFEWLFPDGDLLTGEEVQKSFTQTGEFDVELIVTDEDGLTDTDVVAVEVRQENTAPTASFTSSALTGFNDDVFTFDAADSEDPDGGDLLYFWTFTLTAGENPEDEYSQTAGTESVTNTFPVPGVYSVNLQVEDEVGDIGTTTEDITIDSRTPTADAGEEDTVTVGISYLLDGTASTDPDGSTLQYDWTVDGELLEDVGPTPEVIFETVGAVPVELEVTDEYGNTDSDSITITTENTNPVANAGDDTTALLGEPVTFDGSESSDADGHTLTYEWDSNGDGTFDLSGESATTTYTETGEYTVTLRVTDGFGGESTDTLVVTVIE